MCDGIEEALYHAHGEGESIHESWRIRWVQDVAEDSTLARIHARCRYGDEGHLVGKGVYNLWQK